jgi:hypothetical protein
MPRFSHRFTAASIAVVLLLVPVTAQAAPDRAATAGWGAAVLADLDALLLDAWNRLDAALDTGTDAPEDGSGVALAPPGGDGSVAVTTPDLDCDGELEPSWDPDGGH